MHETIYILYIDRIPAERERIRSALERATADFVIVDVASYPELAAHLAGNHYDLVLGHFATATDFTAIPIAEFLRINPARVPLLILTDPDLEHMALEALQQGATDYLIKTSQYLDHLPFVIRSLIQRRRTQDECQLLRAALQQVHAEREHHIEARTAPLAHTVMLLENEIAERKRIEIALRKSETKFRTLSETLPVAIFIAQPLPGGLRLRYVNPAAEALSGYTREELLALHSWDGLDFDLFTFFDGRMWAIHDGAQVPARYELKTRNKKGNLLWISLSVAVIEFDEQLAIMGTAVDLTERKQAEIALHAERRLLARRVAERTADLSAANAELLRAVRLKDEFLASISHELRTPLNAILGMAGVLQEEVYGGLNSQQQHALQQIEVSGRRLLNMINDMLDLSKIGAGKVALVIDNVALKPVCQASLALFQQEIRQKQLHVTLDYDDAIQTLPADEQRLKQILVNLVSNAVKFTPESGTIGLRVAGDAAGHAVQITVWDTGIGIAAKDMACLFQPFVQLDGRLSRAYGGTGLGLALVYRMVEMHGGSVTVTSSPGEGSCFTVALPGSRDIAPTRGKSLPEEREASILTLTDWQVSPQRPVILIAENNEGQLEHISNYLSAERYQIVVARTGAEAVARAHEVHPDILMLSMHMPDFDALETLHRIRADTSLGPVFITVLTSLALPGEYDRCLAAGVNAYFRKPVHLPNIVTIMELHLQQARRISVKAEGA
ncbi:MAG: ATP-binding protein [Chloroflexaceae bacterium]